MVQTPAEQPRYRALAPAPQPQRRVAPKPKRRLTRIACNNCRSKKLGCDGARPCKSCCHIGVDCVYISENSNETPQMVLRRENEALRAEAAELREVVDRLVVSSDDLAQDTLKRLRNHEAVASILGGARASHQGSQDASISTVGDSDSTTPLQHISSSSDYDAWQHVESTEAHPVAPLTTSASSGSFTRNWIEAQTWMPATAQPTPMFDAQNVSHTGAGSWPVYGPPHMIDPTFGTPVSGGAVSYIPTNYDQRVRTRSTPYIETDHAPFGM